MSGTKRIGPGPEERAVMRSLRGRSNGGMTQLEMLLSDPKVADRILGKAFGSKGPLRTSNGRSSRFSGIVTGGVGRETDPDVIACTGKLGRLCGGCGVEMAILQTECC